MKKLSLKEFILYGTLSGGRIGIGTHKEEFDNLFGKEELGNLYEAYYLGCSALQCYFDYDLKLIKITFKVYNISENDILFDFKEVEELLLKPESFFKGLLEKNEIRYITIKPTFYDGKKDHGGVITERNVGLVLDYSNLEYSLKKDRKLLREIHLDGGLMWFEEIKELAKLANTNVKGFSEYFKNSRISEL